MEMATITYKKITEVYGDEERCDEFEYEVSGIELRRALAKILHAKYFQKTIKENEVGFGGFIANMEEMIFGEELAEQLAEYYEEELRDWFADEAYEWFEAQGGGV